MKRNYSGRERRRFIRLDYTAPLAYKVCKRSTINQILKGYSVNISQSGMLCKLREKVRKGDIIWLAFDKNALSVCKEIEKSCFIYQNGIIGKVVRVERKKFNNAFCVGVQFITPEEINLTNIYPKVHFLEKNEIR